MRIVLDDDRCVLLHGDSANILDVLEENSVDAIVSDPPAGVAFMDKTWDTDKGGRDAWIAWLAGILVPAMRVLRPGGHALLWALPRTSHWTATAAEDAGFEIRDVHHHIFGTGFPKSLNISKAINARLGATRAVVGRAKGAASDDTNSLGSFAPEYDVTTSATAAAAAAEGWGTALKPAVEHWILCRKPFSATVAENFMAHGTGGLNIDACRIGTNGEKIAAVFSGAKGGEAGQLYGESGKYQSNVSELGRWPAHLSLEHCDACCLIGTRKDSHLVRVGEKLGADSRELAFGMGVQATATTTTTQDVYECVLGCPVRLLDEQSGISKDGVAVERNRSPDKHRNKTPALMMHSNNTKPDVCYGGRGGASRFFYVAKGSRSEKDAGLSHLAPKTGGEATGREDDSIGTQNPRAGAGRTGGARNHHPTVKSIDLMRWLIRLITPPGGVVLDMFAGSGTTGVAALAEGCRFVGVEMTDEYVPVIEGRLRHALGQTNLGTTAAAPASDTGNLSDQEISP